MTIDETLNVFVYFSVTSLLLYACATHIENVSQSDFRPMSQHDPSTYRMQILTRTVHAANAEVLSSSGTHIGLQQKPWESLHLVQAKAG